LASGITGIEFQPGTIQVFNDAQNGFSPIGLPSISTPIWFRLLMCAVTTLLPISILLFLKYPEVRKRTFQGLGYVFIYGLILLILTRKTQEESPALVEAEEEFINSSIIETQREASEFISSVAQVDPNFNIILDVTLILIILLVAYYIYRRNYHQPNTSNQLKKEIDVAISEIHSGADLQNVIIQCYAEMGRILDQRRGIQRKQAMTPREFEAELQQIGLPQNPIQRLTRLFETIRYGNTPLPEATEKEAIECLSIIADACQNSP
jgi:hypothetical protein